MEFNYQHQDWSNLKIFGRNRNAGSSILHRVAVERRCVRTKKKEESGKYTCLNGTWKFAYYLHHHFYLFRKAAQQKCL